MKKKLFVTLVIALISIASFAQEKPSWIYSKPKPANNTYIYDVEWGMGKTAREAENEAFAKVFRFAANRIGQPFESNEINRALQSGTDYTVISSQYNIPIYKVCEYPEKNGGEWTVYILCQVASAGNIAVQWSDFNQCDRQSVDGMAVLKSALLPGLGQFHKGQTAKGVCFLAGEALFVGSAVVAQSQRHIYINKMNNTNNATQKKLYADRANTFTTVRTISIGAAATVYVWNVLDAFISKSHHNRDLSYENPLHLTPVITDESVALSLSINF